MVELTVVAIIGGAVAVGNYIIKKFPDGKPRCKDFEHEPYTVYHSANVGNFNVMCKRCGHRLNED